MIIQPFIEPALSIDGWMSDRELYWLAQKAMMNNTIIESGCYKGRSTKVLVYHCKGHVYAVDPWNGPYYRNDGTVLFNINDTIFDEFKRNLAHHSNITICRGTLNDYIDILPPADMIFIDGDHRYEYVMNDIETARKLLKPNGLLCGHDYTHTDWPGVKQAVDDSFSVELIDSIWFTRIK